MELPAVPSYRYGAEDQEWVLLYRASRDGYRAKDFHRYCDAQGATIIVVKVGKASWVGCNVRQEPIYVLCVMAIGARTRMHAHARDSSKFNYHLLTCIDYRTPVVTHLEGSQISPGQVNFVKADIWLPTGVDLHILVMCLLPWQPLWSS